MEAVPTNSSLASGFVDDGIHPGPSVYSTHLSVSKLHFIETKIFLSADVLLRPRDEVIQGWGVEVKAAATLRSNDVRGLQALGERRRLKLSTRRRALYRCGNYPLFCQFARHSYPPTFRRRVNEKTHLLICRFHPCGALRALRNPRP